ncbi:MAG: family 10 glycosylhydrolase [Roseburia sp.]|nr:family 10 glycosylhydrolase [Roseburia sp.]
MNISSTKATIKHFLSAGLLLLLLTLFSSGIHTVHAAEAPEKRACWISYLDMEEFLQDKDEAAFRERVCAMYDKILENNMNTVIVQVRAMGDAIYPSAYYPWSVYISSDRSAPAYDPLQIMVTLAHDKGLQFEAWINPYRISHNNATTESFKATPQYALFAPYLIEYRTRSGQLCLAFDPASQEARALITCGVLEVVNGYDVDGIHFDDYFYVSGMNDALDLPSKKAYVNALILQVYQTIKAVRPACTFGISPAGNLDNARAQGADIDTWLSVPGYIDYIMPQLYWSDMYLTGSGARQMFSERCSAWLALNRLDIPIYTGLALYMAGTPSKTDVGWTASNVNLAYQYALSRQSGCDGYALFRYAWLEKDIAAEELFYLRQFTK